MNIKNFLKNPKTEIQNFNGWQRIWIVVSILILIPTLIVWYLVMPNPFYGISNVNKINENLIDAKTRWSEIEVDCKLNEKYATEALLETSAKRQSIEKRMVALSDENEKLKTSIYWYYPETKRKVIQNEREIVSLREQRNNLNNPVLVKKRKCDEASTRLTNIKNDLSSAETKKYDSLFEFIKGSFLVIFYYLLVITGLYAFGFAIGWIYKGFKK
ncbi:hypothetical protein [Polynucleobacter sp. UK-FUSCHL-C3]|uniref:DUF4349 domain-containing protein n=1 Tax=Polynucleobacter sp. UK-FUSCHL-C3 TaxID=2955208 RepID=A0AAU7ZZV2_9BURK